MNRQDKIDKIYEVVADKELSFGCKIIDLADQEMVITWVTPCVFYWMYWNDNWACATLGIKETKGHPVMIGDVLDYMDKNCNYNLVAEWQYSRDLDKHKEQIIWLYNYFIWRHNKPIEEQSDECIDYIYELIK